MSDWLTLSQTGGTGDTIITVTASSSSELAMRFQSLNVVTTSRNTSRTVNIAQFGTGSTGILCYYYVNDSSITYDYIFNSGNTNFTRMSVDGGEWQHADYTYRFASEGGHYIQYELTGTTEIPANAFCIPPSAYSTSTIYPIDFSNPDAYILYGVAIGDDIVGIGESSFENQHFLQYCEFGNSIKIIRYKAFYACGRLIEADIPDSCKVIQNASFCYCSSLSDVQLPNGLLCLGQIDQTNYANPGNGVFGFCPSVTQIDIPSTIKVLPKDCFANCTGLTTVTGGANVESIDDRAFAFCSSLATIPNGWSATLKEIGIGAFQETNLTNITFNNLINIGYGAFSGCSSLWSVIISGSSSELDYVPEYCFVGCSSLTTVHLNSTTYEIKEHAFYGCSGLQRFTFPSSLLEIGVSSFEGTDLRNIFLPDNIEIIPDRAFSGCCNCTGLTLPAKCRVIGNSSFNFLKVVGTIVELPNMGTLNIPNTVTKIGSANFGQLTTINAYPSRAPKITRNTFLTVSISDPQYIHYPTQDDNDSYLSEWKNTGYLLGNYMKDLSSVDIYSTLISKVVVYYTATTAGSRIVLGTDDSRIFKRRYYGSTTWEDVTTTINFGSAGEYAYEYCIIGSELPEGFLSGVTAATYVYVNDSIKFIGIGCCKGANKIEEIRLPSETYVIRHEAFKNCTALSAVQNTDKVLRYGDFQFTGNADGCFTGCLNLTAVTLPNTVKTLSYRIATGTGLKDIVFPAGPILGTHYDLHNAPSATTAITIPDGAYHFYGIGPSSAACQLTGLTIPSSIREIGSIEGYNLSIISSYPTTAPIIAKYIRVGTYFNPSGNLGTLHYPSGSDYTDWLYNASNSSSAFIGINAYGWTGIADL